MGPYNFDRAYDRLEEAYNRGDLTDKEFREEVRLLHEEQRSAAEEAALEAYNDTMGIW